MKKLAGKIDLTPTWSQALNLFITVLEDGTTEGKKIAREELKRMASLLDQFIANQKTETGQTKLKKH